MKDIDLLEEAWGIIANSNHGDWTRETNEWRLAAEAWREKYHVRIAKKPAGDSVVDFIPGFVDALHVKLLEDEKRWGETWKHRTRAGQTERIRATYNNYFDKERHGGVKVNWLAVAGNAMIAWIREQEGWVEPEELQNG